MSVDSKSSSIPDRDISPVRLLCWLLAAAIAALAIGGPIKPHAASAAEFLPSVEAPSGLDGGASAKPSCLPASACWTMAASLFFRLAVFATPERFGAPASGLLPSSLHPTPPIEPPRSAA